MHEKNNKKKTGKIGLLALILVIVAVIVAVMVSAFLPERPAATPVQTTAGTAGTADNDAAAQPELSQEQQVIALGYGLEITDSGKYTGLYMEDGSNEVLSDVMMVVVQNNGEQDIQLAEITAVSGETEYHFTLTNLAVGARAVLLDTDRQPSGGILTSAVLGNTALFQEPMSLCEDVIQVTGMDGMVNVQNISDTDITGDVYVYYKYAADDLFYGGITFRIRVEGGLAAGEIRQIPAGHYTPDGCAIIQVTVYD